MGITMAHAHRWNRGKLIVVDGSDGVGKGTQVALLVKRLKKDRVRVKTMDFPQYEKNFCGALIRRCLSGTFGNFLNTDPYIASILYAADRFESSKKIKRWLDGGKTVVLDRYVSANQIHQGGKIKDEQKRETFLNWLDKIEHGVFSIPRPDLIIYLDVPTTTAQKLIEQKSARNYTNGMQKDKNESNIDYQSVVRERCLGLISKINNWQRIICEENGRLLSIDDIHEKIWAVVEKMV